MSSGKECQGILVQEEERRRIFTGGFLSRCKIKGSFLGKQSIQDRGQVKEREGILVREQEWRMLPSYRRKNEEVFYLERMKRPSFLIRRHSHPTRCSFQCGAATPVYSGVSLAGWASKQKEGSFLGRERRRKPCRRWAARTQVNS